jgi:hypothetical protein
MWRAEGEQPYRPFFAPSEARPELLQTPYGKKKSKNSVTKKRVVGRMP